MRVLAKKPFGGMTIFIDVFMEIVYITDTGQRCPYEKRPAA